MAYSSDKLFNLGWGLVGVMVGVSLLLWALGVVNYVSAIVIWLFGAGIIALGLGFVRTEEAPNGSFTLIASGGVVVAISCGILGAVLDLIPLSASIGIIIIIISLLIVLTSIMGSKGKEDKKDA